MRPGFLIEVLTMLDRLRLRASRFLFLMGIYRSQIELVREQTSAAKRFLIRGVTPAELSALADAAVARSADR
jgi:hypothetical protein